MKYPRSPERRSCRRLLSGCMVLALGFFLLTDGRGRAAAAETSTPSQFSGTVVDEQGRPVAGAPVDCYHYESATRAYGNPHREPELKQHSVTDSKGGFTVPGALGETLVVVKKAGLAPAWKTWTSTLADSSEPLVLTAPTTLAGVVVDENHHPVAGAEVWVSEAIVGDEFARAPQLNKLFGQPAREGFSVRTGTDGRFRFESFPADAHAALAVKATGKARRPIGNSPVGGREFQSGQQGIEIMVGPAGTVEGTVKAEGTGQPISGVKLWLQPNSSGTYGRDSRPPVETGVLGEFRIPDVQPGAYIVKAAFLGHQIPDWVMSPTNAQVTVVAGKTVREAVVYASKGTLVEVKVVSTNDLTPLENVSVSSLDSIVHTGSDGSALFRAESKSGRIWLSASKEGWFPHQSSRQVEAGQTNALQIELIPAPKLTGIARDPAGKPVPGVLVTFHPGHFPGASLPTEAKTDANGRYEMLLPQQPQAMFWNGHINPTNFLLARGFERNLAAVQEFAGMPKSLDLEMKPAITLSGSVKDTEGSPLASAVVVLSLEAAGSITKVDERPAKVDAQGGFIIPALPQGREYSFLNERISARGYGTAYGRVTATDTRTNRYEFPDFVLQRADRTLSGLVLGPDDQPVAGATVRINGPGQREGATAKSDSAGRFVLSDLCEGDVYLQAETQNPPASSESRGYAHGYGLKAQTGDTNVVLRLRAPRPNPFVDPRALFDTNAGPGLTTRGKVLDSSGVPVREARVEVWRATFQLAPVLSDAAGNYTVQWQRTRGDAAFSFAKSSLVGRDPRRNLAASADLDASTTNLDLRLEEGLTLSGRVQDSSGTPVTNASLRLHMTLNQAGRELATTNTDAQGAFVFRALPRKGEYNVSVDAAGYESVPIIWTQTDTARSNRLELAPIRLAPVKILPATLQLSGVVLEPDGKPAPEVWVVLGSTRPTWSDKAGRFSFAHLSPGLQTVSANRPGEKQGEITLRGEAHAESGETNVVIQLSDKWNPSASLRVTTGTVFDPSGAPAPRASLSVYPPSGPSPLAQSGPDGKFMVKWRFLPSPPGRDPRKSWLIVREMERNLASIVELPNSATNLDVRLRPGLALSGSVRDTQGRPVPNARLLVTEFPAADKSFVDPEPLTSLGAQGLFSIKALPQESRYNLHVFAEGYGRSGRDLAANETRTAVLDLPPIILRIADQEVSGQVIGLDGQPFWGAEIRVRGEGQPSDSTAVSAADGHFVVKRVCEGALEVSVAPGRGSGIVGKVSGVAQARAGDTNIVVRLVQADPAIRTSNPINNQR